MRLLAVLSLPIALFPTVFAHTPPSSSSEAHHYSEHLHLQPLPGGYLYAGFNFTSSTPLGEYHGQRFRYFPRSLAQILQFTETEELHLRFALGRWDEELWGSRPRNGTREGGTGVELWAWLRQNDGASTLETQWTSLVNTLSGLFCASLNFIDGTKTTRPVLTFIPEGDHETDTDALQLLHGALPHEVVCTENLTPLLKLLPCKGKTGISTLLDGHKVFDANWQTMSIDVRPRRDENGILTLEVQQTVDMVLDIERSMRPRDNPIPRPPPIEEMECDETKPYHGHDTCYPRPRDYESQWSLSRIFGRPLTGSCRFDTAEVQSADISLHVPAGRKVERIINGVTEVLEARTDLPMTFTVPNEDSFDLALPRQTLDGTSSASSDEELPLLASRQMTGYGQERGGMHTRIHNPRPQALRIVYFESLPWFLRPYMHTLQVTGAKLTEMYYKPAIDRERGTQLELLLDIPADSIVDLSYDFEKAILRYTEYPPDANRGFDIPPAVIRVLSLDAANGTNRQGDYLRTTSLLLPLPTPDFSMPYNVIILTSTVIALGFGSIFNLLVRRIVLADEVPESPLVARIKAIREFVQSRLQASRKRSIEPANATSHKERGKQE